jgi:hypothetical protein
MKIQVYSDLHLEFYDTFPKLIPTAKYLILAGDIGIINETCFTEFIQYVSERWIKVFYVLGNHEYYKHKDCNKVFQKYVEFFKKFENVILLQQDMYDIIDDETNEEWCIMGCTLWGFYPEDCPYDYISSLRKIYKKQEINQNNKIVTRTIPITREIFNNMYESDKNWILKHLNIDKNIILITHFPVKIEGTSHPIWDDEKYKTIFATDLNLEKRHVNNTSIKLICIGGHTHYSHDFTYNNIRYISNQMGMEDEFEKGITEYNESGLYII